MFWNTILWVMFPSIRRFTKLTNSLKYISRESEKLLDKDEWQILLRLFIKITTNLKKQN